MTLPAALLLTSLTAFAAADDALPPSPEGARAADVYVVDTRGSVGRAPDVLYRAPIGDFFQQSLVGATNPGVRGIDFTPNESVLHAVVSSGAATHAATFGMVDPSTGSYTPIGPLGLVEGDVAGLAIDPRSGTVFVTGTTGAASLLYTVDAANGAAGAIGRIAAPGIDTDIAAIAIDCDGRLLGIDRISDTLVSIDRATAAATTIGPTGYSGSGGLALDFDPQGATLVAWIHLGAGQTVYGTVSSSTGALTPLANGPDGTYEGTVRASCPPEPVLFSDGFE